MKLRIRKEIFSTVLGLPDDFKFVGVELESDYWGREYACLEFETDKEEFVQAAESSEDGYISLTLQTVYPGQEEPDEYVSRIWPGALFLLEVRPE